MVKRLDYESAVATGRGDDGTTGLLFGGDRVYKDDLRTESFGTIDEAVAALGVARAELGHVGSAHARTPAFLGLPQLLLRVQRELFVVGAELATSPENRDKGSDGVSRVSGDMVDAMDATLREMESVINLPREFVVPGETRASAALELARTILRRAERRSVTLAQHDPAIAAGHLLAYLNRLADLLWILARVAEQGEAREATRARTGSPAADRTQQASTEDRP